MMNVKKDELDYPDESGFLSQLDTRIDNGIHDFNQTLNIAIIGKVSSGKSSFINALLDREKHNSIAEVGCQAGTTGKLNVVLLGDHVRLIDSPGLDDVYSEKSEITINFMKHIDVGILVLTGATDESQKKHLDDLSRYCNSIFVVLNKIDEFDNYDNTALVELTDKWEKALEIDTVYPICVLGYDPQYRKDRSLDIRGVDRVRNDIEGFLSQNGKDLFLSRYMGKKKIYARNIILTAVFASATQIVLPAGAAVVTVAQVTAISSLHFLYTGKALSPKVFISLLPTFTAQNILSSSFLWIQSFLPPTLVLDATASMMAASMTLTILLTVNFMLENGEELNEKKRIQEKFRQYRQAVDDKVRGVETKKYISWEFWKNMISELIA